MVNLYFIFILFYCLKNHDWLYGFHLIFEWWEQMCQVYKKLDFWWDVSVKRSKYEQDNQPHQRHEQPRDGLKERPHKTLFSPFWVTKIHSAPNKSSHVYPHFQMFPAHSNPSTSSFGGYITWHKNLAFRG